MNKAVPLLILTTVAPALACLHLVRELRAERAQTESLQARIAELEKAAAAQQVFTVLPRASPFSPATEQPARSASEASPGAPSRAAEATVASASPPQEVQARMREHMERRREMLKRPEYREAMRTRARLDMRRHYPGLMEELQMTDDEANRLFDLLADQQLREMEENDALFLDGNPDEAQLREAQQRHLARAEQHQAEIEMQLGPKYQQWREYQETLGQRHRLAAVQSTLALGGAPLNQEQADSLLSALVQEQRRQQQQLQSQVASAGVTPGAMVAVDATGALFPGHEEWLKNQEQSNERLLNAVKSSLTSKQFERLEEMLDGEIELQRTHLELQKAQGESGGRIIAPRGALQISGFTMTAPQPVIAPRAESAASDPAK